MKASSKPREVDNNIQDIVKVLQSKIELGQNLQDNDTFKNFSTKDKQRVLYKVSSHYNELVINNQIRGASLVQSDSTSDVRYKCCNYRSTNKNSCNAAIWISKSLGKLRDTLNHHKEDCLKEKIEKEERKADEEEKKKAS